MTKPQCIISRRSPDDRRQLLQNHPTRRTNRVGEVVGGAMAEVAAVCCCVPCAVVDFMVLTMYKVPAGLCRNAMRKRRRRRLMMRYNGGGRSVDEELGALTSATVETFMAPAPADKDVVAFENEMWDKFSETGFWRSPSNVGNVVVSKEVISRVVSNTN
ncbi:uncharacterized protein LOC143627946 [Bidens hawaiensis]|uniref:uncharacterized protein LOC143627946 n=1 Tax=Bidens hawaiensis TaxID=980011 RepID=UPI00404BA1B1